MGEDVDGQQKCLTGIHMLQDANGISYNMKLVWNADSFVYSSDTDTCSSSKESVE
jgi:hypothetical protein